MLRRQKHARSESTTPFACTLTLSIRTLIADTFFADPVSETPAKDPENESSFVLFSPTSGCQ